MKIGGNLVLGLFTSIPLVVWVTNTTSKHLQLFMKPKLLSDGLTNSFMELDHEDIEIIMVEQGGDLAIYNSRVVWHITI